jgi:hypothetical protein
MIWEATLPRDEAIVYPQNARWLASCQRALDRGAHDVLVRLPDAPALLVSRESRSVALPWALASGARYVWGEGTTTTTTTTATTAPVRGPVLARPFDETRDVLYTQRGHRTDRHMWLGCLTRSNAARVRALAVPAWNAYYGAARLARHFHRLSALEVVYVVFGDILAHLMLDPERGGVAGVLEEDRELYPRWTLRPETAETARMCVVEPYSGHLSWEENDLAEWMQEITDELAEMALPAWMKGSQGELTLRLEPVKLVTEAD